MIWLKYIDFRGLQSIITTLTDGWPRPSHANVYPPLAIASFSTKAIHKLILTKAQRWYMIRRLVQNRRLRNEWKGNGKWCCCCPWFTWSGSRSELKSVSKFHIILTLSVVTRLELGRKTLEDIFWHCVWAVVLPGEIGWNVSPVIKILNPDDRHVFNTGKSTHNNFFRVNHLSRDALQMTSHQHYNHYHHIAMNIALQETPQQIALISIKSSFERQSFGTDIALMTRFLW